MASKPTQRTLKALRDMESQGVVCQVVEQWKSFKGFNRNPNQAGVRVDLFGFIDIVAITPAGIVGIQCTSGANTAARIAKIRGACGAKARAWLQAGGRIEVWGWRQLRKKGKNKNGTKRQGKSWEPKIQPITLEDLQ